MQVCQRRIKRIQAQAKNGDKGNQALSRNVQASLAGKLQAISGEFRQQQASYLERGSLSSARNMSVH
jgi:hypothetical protein